MTTWRVSYWVRLPAGPRENRSNIVSADTLKEAVDKAIAWLKPGWRYGITTISIACEGKSWDGSPCHRFTSHPSKLCRSHQPKPHNEGSI